MKKQTLGIICLILGLLTFVVSVCLNYEKFNIPYLNGLFTPVAVNVEISKQYQNSIKINGEKIKQHWLSIINGANYSVNPNNSEQYSSYTNRRLS